MKLVQSIGVWGDSVMKGVVYDENKSKYTLLSENGADKASRKLGCDCSTAPAWDAR